MTYDDEFTKIKQMRLSPKSAQQPYPPVWIGARDPKGIKRAARNRYNLMVTFESDLAPLYTEILMEKGKTPDNFKITQLRMYYIGETEDQAWEDYQDHLFHTLDFYRNIVKNANDAEGDSSFFPINKPKDRRHSVLIDHLMVGTLEKITEKIHVFAGEYNCTDLVGLHAILGHGYL